MIGAGASVELGPSLALSLGGSYNFRDEYISAHATDIGGRLQYSPGNQLSLNAGLSYEVPAWLLNLNIAYRTEQASDSFGPFIGPASFKLGDTISLDASARYVWTPQHATTLFLAFSHISDNEHLEGFFAYTTKNSNVYEVALSHDYRVLSWLTVFGRVSWRERPLEDEDQLLAPRTRLAGEAGIEVRPTDKLLGRLTLGRLHVEEHGTDFSNEVETKGWYGSFAATMRW